VHAQRLVASRLGDNSLNKRLFDEIAPRFANRPGGYTRVLKLGPRMGDQAEMVILELVEE
jgi:large subunit ribosomal protein L17